MDFRYFTGILCLALGASLDSAMAASQLTYNASVTTWGPISGCTDGIAPWPIPTHYGGQICQAPAQLPVEVGQSFTDPNMGGISTAVTPPTGTFVHGYSLPSPMSANNRYLQIRDPNGFQYLIDRTAPTFAPISGAPGSAIWDPYDDSVYYYISGARIMKYRVDTRASAIWIDYTGRFDSLQNGGSVHQSSDGWTTFWSPKQRQVCAVDLVRAKTYCADYFSAEANTPAIGYSFIDYAAATDIDRGTGKRYALLLASPALAAWSVDLSSGTLKFEFRGPEMPASLGFNNPRANGNGVCDPGENCLNAPHGDLTSIDGVQYFITVADTAHTPCERDLAAFPIAQGLAMVAGRTTLAPMGYCSSMYEWPDYHIGCAPRTGACVISTLTTLPAPYGNQLMVMRDLTHLVKLGYHHSVPRGSDGYWYSPRAALSPDGQYVIYDSNFGRPDQGNGYAHEQVLIMPVNREVTAMAVSPAGGPELSGGQTRQFTASVSGADPRVVWSISPQIGSVSSTGLYSAPSFLTGTHTVTVTATSVLDPQQSASATVIVSGPTTWLSHFTLGQATYTGGGTSANNYVYLTAPAPATGAPVSIVSGDPAIVQVPANTAVAAGSNSTSFVIGTAVVAAPTPVTMNVTAGGVTQSAVVNVMPAQLATVTLFPTCVTAGSTSTENYIRLTGAAFTGGLPVTIVSSNPAVVRVPSGVIVAAGSDVTSFAIGTASVATLTPVIITVSAGGRSRSVGMVVAPVP